MTVGQSPGIRSVQRGTFSINNTNTTDTISITAVVVAKCRTSGGSGESSTSRSLRVGELTATTVRWRRQTGSADSTRIPPFAVIERY